MTHAPAGGPPPAPAGPPGQHGRPVHLARGYSLSARGTAIALGAIGAIGIGIAALWPVSSVDSGPPSCVFRLLFGVPCPGCGMTRAWVHVAHGDVAGAFWYNPFGLLLMAMAAFAAVYVIQAMVRRRPPERMLGWISAKPAVALFGLWIGWSAFRIWSIAQGQDTWGVVVA